MSEASRITSSSAISLPIIHGLLAFGLGVLALPLVEEALHLGCVKLGRRRAGAGYCVGFSELRRFAGAHGFFFSSGVRP